MNVGERRQLYWYPSS